jgi:hypothetical protein
MTFTTKMCLYLKREKGGKRTHVCISLVSCYLKLFLNTKNNKYLNATKIL